MRKEGIFNEILYIQVASHIISEAQTTPSYTTTTPQTKVVTNYTDKLYTFKSSTTTECCFGGTAETRKVIVRLFITRYFIPKI
jgi:hypothetical protein